MAEATKRHWTRADILPLLGPVKPGSNGDVMAFCPAHPDGTKHRQRAGHSLVVHQDGTCKCFAGCDWPSIEQALIALGGAVNGHRRQAQQPKSASRRHQEDDGAKWAHIESYEYRTIEGDLLAVKGRFERPAPDTPKGYEKRFAWRLPKSEKWAGFEGKYQVVDMPLWGVAEIAGTKGRVWFAEGENATKAIRKAGEVATCGAWGASTHTFNEDTFEVFRGRDVILWPDNDQAGREYMAAVRRAIRPVAKSITVVAAPVPPGGDAVEYFSAGGKVADLLEGVIFEPTVDVLAQDRLTVRMPADSNGALTFEFEDLHYKREALEANLTVQASWEPETYDQFINLKSQSTREGLVRALKAQFGGDQNWTQAVSVAYSRVKRAYDEVPKAIQVDELPDEPDEFLIDTLVPSGAPTVFFGLGSSGKSTLTKRLALEIALGGEFLGYRVTRPGGVVVMDYEDPKKVRRWFRRILAGMDLDPELLRELPIYFWPPRGESLASHVSGLRRFCEEREVVAVLIDSAMPACGGEPEKSEPALAFFNALSAVGVTSIIVSHVSKGEADLGGLNRPYGNVVWENMPRRVWAVQRTNNQNAKAIDVLLRCTKTNLKYPDPVSCRMVFEESGLWPVRYVRTEVTEVAEFGHALPMETQLRRVLEDEPAGLELPQILERLTGAPKVEAVRAALNRGKNVFEGERTGYGRGARTVWRVITTVPACHRCGQPSVGLNNTGQEACENHA